MTQQPYFLCKEACGCITNRGGIVYCSTHAAAPDMLTMLGDIDDIAPSLASSIEASGLVHIANLFRERMSPIRALLAKIEAVHAEGVRP